MKHLVAHLVSTAGILLLSVSTMAATVVQVKGSSAIIELTDFEIQDLSPAAGQNLQITFNGQQIDASVKKVAKKKILISTSGDLSGQKTVEISAGGSGASASSGKPAKRSKSGSATSRSGKSWIMGANAKYVMGGSAKITILSSEFDVAYSGFDLSGTGIYYWGSVGAGVEGEYAMLKGTEGSTSHTITQMQLSLLGEYKFSSFSAGALLTIASNYKSSDDANNENSLNGNGYGVFFTYSVIPQVRLIFDYRMVNYSLDSATIKTSDMRLGAGYYF